MGYLQRENAEKLLASTRLGLNIWVPEVIGNIEKAGKAAFDEVAGIEFESQSEALRRVNPLTGMILIDRPLRTVCLYIECFRDQDGRIRFGKFGTDLIPSERGVLGDGREYQIPHVSIRILHDGWRSEIIRAPMGFVCSSHILGEASVVYEHRYFPPVHGDPSLVSRERNDLTYVGVTRKTWASRWREHLQSARSGSPYDFHEAIRQFEGQYHSMHTVLSVCQSWDVALDQEEQLVAVRSLRPKGLNMIPGGKAGIAFAARYGVDVRVPRKWEQRDGVIRAIKQHAGRKGLPNPVASLRLLNDPDLMRRMVEARDNTFSSNEVAVIRSMFARGVDWRSIAQELGVKDIYRVRDVVEGRTYKFVT